MNTVMIWQLLSTGPADTERLGELLGKHLRGGEVLELVADLGGGKTTFVRGLVLGAGSGSKVSSPTFTLNRIYRANNFDIHHFDFYRLDEPGIVADQLAESLNNPDVVTVVEWSDIVKNVLPDARLTLHFRPITDNPDGREITIKYPASLVETIKKVEAQWEPLEP